MKLKDLDKVVELSIKLERLQDKLKAISNKMGMKPTMTVTVRFGGFRQTDVTLGNDQEVVLAACETSLLRDIESAKQSLRALGVDTTNPEAIELPEKIA